MKLTHNQMDCLQKAKKYRKGNMQTKPFRRLYIDFCRDSYISGENFVQLVKGNNITTLHPTTKEKPIREYLKLFEDKILGKGTGDCASRREKDGNTNQP